MPIKSKAQRRKFAELLVEGKIKPETYERWNREAGGAELPERVKRRRTSTSRTAKKSAKKRTTTKKTARKTAKRKTAKRKTARKSATATRSRNTSRSRKASKQ